MSRSISYVELHCHSNFSFEDGASHIEELLGRAKELGYPALALTDHNNLYAAMRFARSARLIGIQPITGCEVTLLDGSHLTLLAATSEGYRNLCRMQSEAHISQPRGEPALDPMFLAEHTTGLIALSGCARGEIPTLLVKGKLEAASALARRYREWFGQDGFYIELQNNLVHDHLTRIDDLERNQRLLALGRSLSLPVVATNNAHYHVRERHRLQDAIVAIHHNKSLDEVHQQRRPNSEFHLKSSQEMALLFRGLPEAVDNTVRIAGRCTFDLTRDLGYRFPDYQTPDGSSPDEYLQRICWEAARRRYSRITPKLEARLAEEFRLIRKHGLAGFLLLYRDILLLAREKAVELGICKPGVALDEDPPGRSRGSSVALVVGFLLGLSHIDPMQHDLGLERFLHDEMYGWPDIDTDWPREVRERLLVRIFEKWGWQYAAITAMFPTYRTKGVVHALGKALALPPQDIDKLAEQADHYGSAQHLEEEMRRLPGFRNKVDAPGWRELLELGKQLAGFPRGVSQHPGGVVVSSTPLCELVPIQRSAIEGRYIIQWDKDDIDDLFVKIDVLAIASLSAMQESVELIRQRHGRVVDLSRIDFDDSAVYDMLGEGDTVGVFQVESAAQQQTIVRLKPRNLTDLAIEVALVRPGVGATDSAHIYLARRLAHEPVTYDHPLEERALERTKGAVVYQDQLNQLAVDVAGFSSGEADQLRRLFTKRNGQALIPGAWERFRSGALARGVPEEAARRIFAKFTGQYMFPESHSYAFAATSFQAAWLKRYYPLEFYCGVFNAQPMGFYSVESLKEDARRHDVSVLHPDVNRSLEKCTPYDEGLLLGLLNVQHIGPIAAKATVQEREARGAYQSVADFMERVGLERREVESLVEAGAFDAFSSSRRRLLWEVGLRYRPASRQLALPLSIEQDEAELKPETSWDRVSGEYKSLNLSPNDHLMPHLRPALGEDVVPSYYARMLPEGEQVTVAGVVIRRQRPETAKNVVFMTLEDEFGHTPLVVWPQVMERYRDRLREPMLVVEGTVSRRDGTFNVVVQDVRVLSRITVAPKARNWR